MAPKIDPIERPAARLLIIGIDGGDWDLLDAFIEAGHMPNLGSLVRRGAKGELTSCFPPVTAPAWTSMVTGVNPGRHGIVDFMDFDVGYSRRPVNRLAIREATLWQRASDAGLRTVAVNVPLSYPPPEHDGVFVSGMMTPSRGKLCHPAGALDSLDPPGRDYIIDVPWTTCPPDGIGRFLERMLLCVDRRADAMAQLARREQWDLFFGVFVATDRIQHFLFRYVRPDTRRSDAIARGFHDQIAAIFRRIDAGIGELVEIAGEDAAIMITSDHGFRPVSHRFRLNRWLLENDYLSLDLKKRMLVELRPGTIKRRIRELVRNDRPPETAGMKLLALMNWKKTSLFTCSRTSQGCYVNDHPRFPAGRPLGGDERMEIAREVQRRLDSDERLAKHLPFVIRREQLYYGDLAESCPDLFFVLDRGALTVSDELGAELVPETAFHLGDGTHRMNGVLLLAGPEFREGEVIEMSAIFDVFPTALHLLGIEVPRDLDGAVVEEAFTEESRARWPITKTDAAPEGARAPLDGPHGFAGAPKQVRDNILSLGRLEEESRGGGEDILGRWFDASPQLARLRRGA